MKTVYLTLLSVGLLTSSLHAGKAIEAQLVSSTVSVPLEEGIQKWQLGLSDNEGTTLTFMIRLAQVVSIDKGSLNLNGWTIAEQHRSRFTDELASFKINHKFYQGDISQLSLDGSIVVNVGSKLQNKTITLKKDDKPIKLPDFKVSIEEDAHMGLGIRFDGTVSMLKSIKVENDGKEIDSNGSSSSSDYRTYYYPALNEKSKIAITYFSDIKKQTIKITK